MTPQMVMQEIKMRFNAGEIKTLCFDLGVDYDSLPVSSNSKIVLARELVLYMQRHGRFGELVNAIKHRVSIVELDQGGTMPQDDNYLGYGFKEMGIAVVDWSKEPTVEGLISAHATIRSYVASYADLLGLPVPPALAENMDAIAAEIHRRVKMQKQVRLLRLQAQRLELRPNQEKRDDVDKQIAELERELEA